MVTLFVCKLTVTISPQDIHQLRSLYGTSAGTFLSNAGVLQAFGVNDYDTADMLSKTMGRETITYETGGQAPRSSKSRDPRISNASLTAFLRWPWALRTPVIKGAIHRAVAPD